MTRGGSTKRLPNAAIGVIAMLLILFGFYLAFTKRLPFTSRGYQIQGVFANAQNLRIKSPVRIAGVNVGEVTEVKALPDSNAAVVKMTVLDAGRPVHSDARMQLRPRLFLEGNLFVDLHPGSPSAPELESNAAIPIQQTSNSVQLDQVLTTLQADVRGNLQLLLKEVGDAFQKYGGAEGFREAYLTGGPAFKNTSLVNEALLGTRAHDLSGLVRNFDRVAKALDRNETQLKDLVTNLRVVTGSFAAEDVALKSAIHELPGVLDAARPALANLNASFPFVRAFAREALPGVRSSAPAIHAATPFIAQLRGLVSKQELRGLTADLRPTIPQLAKLTRRQRPFMEQARALASCFTQVVIPWSNDTVVSFDEGSFGKVYEDTGYGLVGIAGESRSGDANGQYIRVGLGGGQNTVVQPPAVTGLNQTLFGITPFPILGSEPALNSSAKTPLEPTIPCENQEPPDLRSNPGAAPQQFTSNGAQSILQGPLADTKLGGLTRQFATRYMDYLEAEKQAASSSSRKAENQLVDAGKALADWSEQNMGLYKKLVNELGGGG